MPIHKTLVDHLRAHCVAREYDRPSAGHAHELVSAFFGYATAAGLRADQRFPIENIEDADVLIPDIEMIKRRLTELVPDSGDLPPAGFISETLVDHLKAEGCFSGKVWVSEGIRDVVDVHIIPEYTLQIMDELGGEMASTNAIFDSIYIEKVEQSWPEDDMQIVVTGILEGENDPDRAYVGQNLNISVTFTFERVSGRVAFKDPEHEAGGEVDREGYYDPIE